MERFDLVIIGGGAAAFAAALKANEFGAQIAMIERGNLGGTCVNVGCVPTKFLLEAAKEYYMTKNSRFSGVKFKAEPLDFTDLIAQKDAVVNFERQTKYSDVISAYPNINLIKGTAKFTSPTQIQIDGRTIEGEKFIIATGSTAQVIPIPGLDEIDYLTNIEALDQKELPKSLIVLGGRAVGLEFAQIYSRLGTKVTLLQRSTRIIPEEEPEIAQALEGYLTAEGMEIVTGVNLQKVAKRNGGVAVDALVNGRPKEFTAEKLLAALGRKPNTAGLSLENAAVETDQKGFVKVNEELRTGAAHIYAAGDVIGEPMLETVAAKEGSIAAFNAMSGVKKKTMDYTAIPHAVFTDPAVASVGLTDKKANESGFSCACRTVEMAVIPKAKIIQDTRGLIKIVANAQTEQILGVHILSPLAHELINEATLAVKFKLTIDDIIDTVHIFPALSESIKLAAQSFKRDISKMSCCVE